MAKQKAKEKKLSLFSQGLKHKLNVAFCLMSVLPLLVCTYLVSNYILPKAGLKLDIAVSMLISIFIAFAGFFALKEIFNRIQSVSTEAKLIAAGDIERKVEIGQNDELGYLGEALNQLTERIRSNMEELKTYGEKTTEINFEINKRIATLSNLLQISSLISSGDKLENILKITIEKAKALVNSDVAYLFIKEQDTDNFYAAAVSGMNSNYILQLKIDHNDKAFNKLIKTNQPLILDKGNALSEELKKYFFERFKLNSTLVLPIHLKEKTIGILGIGSVGDAILYKKDDIELLELFAKQLAIALGNDILMERVGKLETRDTFTGLYNERFINNRLQEEIKRAIMFRRPCAFILFNIDNFQQFIKNFGKTEADAALKRTASLIKDSFTDIDRVARIGDDEFAVVLPEKNKRQAKEIAEDLRKKIQFTFGEEEDANRRLTVSAGVSENPLDGIEADELITKAKGLLYLAKTKGKNRIEAVQ